MENSIINFCEKSPLESQEIIKNLSSIILETEDEITTAIKWKKLTFALNEDFHHWICSINFTKKATVLYFHFGGLLEDKYEVFISGESKFLRKIEFKTKEEIDDEIIKDYILQAISKLDYFKENWKNLK